MVKVVEGQDHYRTARRLCWLIICLNFLSLIFWTISSEKIHVVDPNLTSYYSKLFFYLNPSFFRKWIIQGNIITHLYGAVNEDAFIFLISWFITLTSFLSCLWCCFRLFYLSYKLDIRFFHAVSCWGIFPLIGSMFLFPCLVVMMIRKYRLKRGRNWRPEWFEPVSYDDHISKYVALDRPLEDQFTYRHYQEVFKDPRESDMPRKLCNWFGDILK